MLAQEGNLTSTMQSIGSPQYIPIDTDDNSIIMTITQHKFFDNWDVLTKSAWEEEDEGGELAMEAEHIVVHPDLRNIITMMTFHRSEMFYVFVNFFLIININNDDNDESLL